MLGCVSKMLEEDEMPKGGSISPSLQSVLFHRRWDAPRSCLGSCWGRSHLIYVLHGYGLKGGAGGKQKRRLGIEMRTLDWVAFIPKGR